MSKRSVVFKKHDDLVIAVRLTKERINDRSVGFEIVSAADSVDFPEIFFEYDNEPPDKYNLVSSSGELVSSFEESLFICTGKILPSNHPTDLLDNKGYTFNVKFEDEVLLSRRQLNSLNFLLNTVVINLAVKLIDNEEIEEYIYQES